MNIDILTTGGPIFNQVLKYFIVMVVLLGLYIPTIVAGIRRAKIYWWVFGGNLLILNLYRIPGTKEDMVFMLSTLMIGWVVLLIAAVLGNKSGTAEKLKPGEAE